MLRELGCVMGSARMDFRVYDPINGSGIRPRVYRKNNYSRWCAEANGLGVRACVRAACCDSLALASLMRWRASSVC